MQAGLLSREISESGVPTLSQERKATPPAALSRAAGGPRAVREPGMHGTSMRENREIPCSPAWLITGGPLREGRGRNPEMNGRGKSDSPIVPAKPPNNAA